MNQILVERNVTPMKLEVLYVDVWPTRKHEVGSFERIYAHPESSYILAGDATVTAEGADPVHLKRGDMASFAAGLHCRWEIHTPLREHFRVES